MVVGANKMNMCVFGLWHFGSVTAACLAKLGYKVVGLNFDNDDIENLMTGLSRYPCDLSVLN